MKKTITVLTFPKKVALQKAAELETLANKDLYFRADSRAIVLNSNGEFEVFDNLKDARKDAQAKLIQAQTTANAEVVEHYVRGDRKISGKIQAAMTDWVRIKDASYAPAAPVAEVEKAPVKPEVVHEDAIKKPMKDLLRGVFGDNIPAGVGIHITKDADDLKPVVGYETKPTTDKDGIITAGGTKNLTLRDLQLLALLYSTTVELAKGGFGGITLSIAGNCIGPDDATKPFSIVEIEAVLKAHMNK